MKAIKICEANKLAIEAALHDVNGKATAHTYNSYHGVEVEAMYADKAIMSLVGSKKVMVGAILLTTSGDSVASAYEYQREGTALTLVYKTSGWHLTAIVCVALYKNGGRRGIVLTKAQSDKAKADYAKRWSVAPAAGEN